MLRSLELLRSLPDADAGRITILGKGPDGVNGMSQRCSTGRCRASSFTRLLRRTFEPSLSRRACYAGIPRPRRFGRPSGRRGARHLAVGRDVRLPAGVPARPLTEVTHCTLAVTDALPNSMNVQVRGLLPPVANPDPRAARRTASSVDYRRLTT